jgi:hypothetical protein
MGILSDFFIVDASTIPNYRGGKGFDDPDKLQLKRITPLEGAQFLAVLRGQEYAVDMIREFRLVTPEDAEDWTMSVPQDFVSALANLPPSAIPIMATKFAEATREELGWSDDDFIPIVRDLSALARRAVEKQKVMFLWNCP